MPTDLTLEPTNAMPTNALHTWRRPVLGRALLLVVFCSYFSLFFVSPFPSSFHSSFLLSDTLDSFFLSLFSLLMNTVVIFADFSHLFHLQLWVQSSQSWGLWRSGGSEHGSGTLLWPNLCWRAPGGPWSPRTPWWILKADRGHERGCMRLQLLSL